VFKYQAHIPDSQLENLSMMLGKCIGPIYSPALQIFDGYILASSLSLSLSLSGGDGFLNFKTEHQYTKHEHIYWKLCMEKSDSPANIPYTLNGNLFGDSNVTGIYLPQAWFVSGVEIFEAYKDYTSLDGEEGEEEEFIEFDFALVFHRHGGAEQFCSSLCIGSQPNSTDQLFVLTDENIISQWIRNCKLRWSTG
jgi:hypothetical protein